MSLTALNRVVMRRISGVFFCLTLILAMVPAFAYAASDTIDINGVVPGPPPSTAPSIDVPANGAVFDITPITVKGGCTAGLIVKVFRNSLFAGAALCQSNGQYTMLIDLVELQNTLIARQYDTLDQASPDSNTVEVIYRSASSSHNPPSGSTPRPGGSDTAPTHQASDPLVILYNYTVQGVGVDKPFSYPLSFIGGEPPYAISIDWGDGEVSVFSRQDTTVFSINHTYKKPGVYTVKVRVSDKNDKQAYLQFIVVAKGKPSLSPAVVDVINSANPLVIFGVGLIAGILGFILGKFGPRWWAKPVRTPKSHDA